MGETEAPRRWVTCQGHTESENRGAAWHPVFVKMLKRRQMLSVGQRALLPRVAGASLTASRCVRSVLSLGGLRGGGLRD